jgi:hypothetical protein
MLYTNGKCWQLCKQSGKNCYVLFRTNNHHTLLSLTEKMLLSFQRQMSEKTLCFLPMNAPSFSQGDILGAFSHTAIYLIEVIGNKANACLRHHLRCCLGGGLKVL